MKPGNICWFKKLNPTVNLILQISIFHEALIGRSRNDKTFGNRKPNNIFNLAKICHLGSNMVGHCFINAFKRDD